MSYRLWLPPGHDEPGREFPLIVWLHGTGDSNASIPQGILDAAQSDRFAAYVVSPQGSPPGPNEWVWATCHNPGRYTMDCPPGLATNMRSVVGIVEQLDAEFTLDTSRRFVTGYSAGAMGAIEVVMKEPAVFSAAVSISGGYPADKISEWSGGRVWTLHGRSDSVIPIEASRSAADRIVALGGSAIHLEYPGGHEASYRTGFFDDADNELYPWLFEGTEPTLARLLYSPATGSVTIDADSAPGGRISRMQLSSTVSFLPAAVSEIHGDELTVSDRSIRYSASGDGFSGTLNLGNILPAGLDHEGLHHTLQSFRYDSPAASSRNRPFRLVTVAAGGVKDLPGDLNRDGFVDTADFSVLASNFHTSARTAAEGDMNRDGRIDMADFVTFRQAFEEFRRGGGVAVAVPEPHGWLLASFGLLGMGLTRRRKN
jgi:predicted peptidase